MVGNRKRLTNRGQTPAEVMMQAISAVDPNNSIRSVAKNFNINYRTLARYYKKYKNCKNTTSISVGYVKVFKDNEEKNLLKYLQRAENIYFGLTPIEARKLAYQYAVALDLKFPKNWANNDMAGEEWLKGFMRRHRELNIRKLEATSFNSKNVILFFDNLGKILEKYKFEGQNIWNVDEIGVSITNPQKYIARRDIKSFGNSVVGDKLVTISVGVSATGNSIPPFFVFPGKNFKDHFLINGPTGSTGSANPSGWMNEECFYIFIQKFVHYTRCSSKHPLLLLLDNHDSHLSIKTLDYCKENGVVVLSFPPNFSHKIQPLDRSIYGPLKKNINVAFDDWIKNHPGKIMTIYDIPEIVKVSLTPVITPQNIISGFSVSGIWPNNKNIFTEVDFTMSNVTDRPEIVQEEYVAPNMENTSEFCRISSSTSGTNAMTSSSFNLPTTEIVWLFPDAISDYTTVEDTLA